MEHRHDGVSRISECASTATNMENNISQLIELLQKKNTLREAKYAKLQEEQMQQYDILMKQLVSLKEERNCMKDSMVKNLRKLINQQHTVHKLLEDSNNHLENVHGLPISHKYHREAMSLLRDGISFMNHFKHTKESLGNLNDSDSTPAQLVEKLTLCADAVGNEVCRMKSQVFQIETLKENIDVLQN